MSIFVEDWSVRIIKEFESVFDEFDTKGYFYVCKFKDFPLFDKNVRDSAHILCYRNEGWSVDEITDGEKILCPMINAEYFDKKCIFSVKEKLDKLTEEKRSNMSDNYMSIVLFLRENVCTTIYKNGKFGLFIN